jgi:hypothetical protein
MAMTPFVRKLNRRTYPCKSSLRSEARQGNQPGGYVCVGREPKKGSDPVEAVLWCLVGICLLVVIAAGIKFLSAA